jgi:photosystem II stability/assembly factor-like uncharacterized protein
MKSLFILFLIVFLVNISAQNRWKKLNGPPGGKTTTVCTFGDTIMAGVGDNIAGLNGRLYYSFDKGNSWNSFIKMEQPVSAFVMADDNSLIYCAGTQGIYRTTDLKTDTNLFHTGEFFICLIKDKTGTIFSGTDIGHVYSSTNNGKTWTFSLSNNTGYNINNFAQLSDSTIFASTADYIYSRKPGGQWNAIHIDTLFNCNVSTDTVDNIYVFDSGRIRMSTDKGESWTKKDPNGFFAYNYIRSCLYFNNRLIVACDDETEWFGNGWGIAISEDLGLTWKWSNNGFPPKLSTMYLAKSGNDLYVGTVDAGIYKSSDFGDNWISVNNGIISAFTVDINFDYEGNLLAGCWGNGIYKSSDKGSTWKEINNGLTNINIYSVISDDKGILFASTDQGVFRSIDEGETWNLINNNFFFFINKDNNNRIYGLSYGNGLYRTTDQGNTWARLDNGFVSSYVFGFAVDSINNIYTGTSGGAIYKSTDDGLGWVKVYQSSNSNSEVNKIAVAPNGTIFAANIAEGIIRSTDNGLTWKLVKPDPDYVNVYPVNVNKKGIVYTSGNLDHFFSSTDNGNTWKDITDNLKFTIVQAIIFDQNDTMYIATDESVWRSNPDSTVGIKDKSPVILQYSLSQNYPNPFNPSTTVQYSVMNSGLTKIEVYDILGRRVETLVNEEKQPGNYSVTFNAKSITSGVYFCKMEINNYVSVKKMIFLK